MTLRIRRKPASERGHQVAASGLTETKIV